MPALTRPVYAPPLFSPPPAVCSHRSPAIPLPRSPSRPGVRSRRRVGDTRGPDPGDHPGLPASHQPRFPGPRHSEPRELIGWGVGSPGTRASSRLDYGRAAARAIAHGHHHYQLLRGELLHHQQQLRLRPRVPPHPAGAPDPGRDRKCRRAEPSRAGPGRGRQVDWASSRVSSSAHRAGSGLPAGSGNTPELSLYFFVKFKTHIQVLSPGTLLGTRVVTLRTQSVVGGISACCSHSRMVVFPENRILWWAFIDHWGPEYLGPISPDLRVRGSLKTKLFFLIKPTLPKCWTGIQSFTCQLDARSLSRTPGSKSFPIIRYKGENFFRYYLPVVKLT